MPSTARLVWRISFSASRCSFCSTVCSVSARSSSTVSRLSRCRDRSPTAPNRQLLVTKMPMMTGEVSEICSVIGVRPGDFARSSGGTSSMMFSCRNSVVMFVTVMGDRWERSESSLRVIWPAVQIICSSRARLFCLIPTRFMPSRFIMKSSPVFRMRARGAPYFFLARSRSV